jgi:hypothetical protein
MKNSNKAMLAGLAAGIGVGYMAAKRQNNTQNTFMKLLDMVEKHLD